MTPVEIRCHALELAFRSTTICGTEDIVKTARVFEAFLREATGVIDVPQSPTLIATWTSILHALNKLLNADENQRTHAIRELRHELDAWPGLVKSK